MSEQHIGHYRLLESIEIGGQGQVFRAVDTLLDRQVALKRLAPHHFGREDNKQLIREARTLARMRHPNIVGIHGLADDSHPATLVMEFVEGETLARVLERGPLPIKDAINVASQLADALFYASRKGITHGDLKPSNIMLVADGSPKLLDFGLASDVGRQSVLATLGAGGKRPQAFEGTLAYTAPEVFMGKLGDIRSDVFALGCVIHEMITGHPVFRRRSHASTINAVLNETPQSLVVRSEGCPAWIDELVYAMLEKDPAQRNCNLRVISQSLKGHSLESNFGANQSVDKAISRFTKYLPLQRSLKNSVLVVVAAASLAGDSYEDQPVYYGSVSQKVELGVENIVNFHRPGAVSDAERIFAGMLEDDPTHAAGNAGLSLAVMRNYTSKQTDRALITRADALAQAALDNDAHLALAYIAKGWATEFSGDFDGARMHLARARTLEPTNALLLESEIRIARKEGRFEDAERAINAAISLHPDTALFRSYLGDILARQGRHLEAESAFKKALLLGPDDVNAYASLAHSQHVQGKIEAALATIQAGLQVQQSGRLYSNLGTYLYFQGHYELAAKAFESALGLNGDAHDFTFWANLADAYQQIPARQKDAILAYRRAMQIVEERLAERPDHQGLNSRFAFYAARAGEHERAHLALARVTATPILEISTQYRLLITYEALGERDRAIEALAAAFEAGYPLHEIKNDPELLQLRSDIRYHQVIASIKE